MTKSNIINPLKMFPTKYEMPLLGLDFLEYYNKHRVYHPGIDLGTVAWSDYGQDVVAAKAGHIEYVSPAPTRWNRYNGGLGWFIIIIHTDGNYSRYAHLKEVASGIKVAKYVKEGGLIGFLGRSGTKSPHLHFEVFNKGMAEIQGKHWRKWCYYPSRKSKQYVQKYYLNPWEWLATQEVIPEWARESWEKAVKLGKAPKDPNMEVDMLEFQKILKNLGLISKAGKMPAYRAMALIDKISNLY